ncbi:MAG: ribosome biogenesis GTPase Der [Gammaproteobacteria bacterium]|nr:MAG: ribosome biogenesis GTPase Der [Gammaproteobacteria bacterium]
MITTALPSIVLVGRPNVGKSSLFNCLTKTRQALVAITPGLTRDRLYGKGMVGSHAYIIVDTGGLTGDKERDIAFLMEQQTQRAITEADHVLFLVNAREGLSALDQQLAQRLRRLNKKITLVINKSEGLDPAFLQSEFSPLGFDVGTLAIISAAHGLGIRELMEKVLSHFPSIETSTSEKSFLEEDITPRIRVSIIGKPNVGKSTLLNRILGEDRAIVFDQPGTTRDSTANDIEYRGKLFTFIDTAGIRRKSKTTEGIEKFSVIKSLQAIESSNVVLLVVDAQKGISEQDLHLLGFILETGRALIIVVNKWDNLSNEQRMQVKKDLDRRLQFVPFAKLIFISALHGTGVGNLFGLIQQAYRSATQNLTTSRLTRLLEQAVSTHQPPLSRGRNVKLRYAHPGGYNPPVILIHGQHASFLPESYRRYLENFFRKSLKIIGSPIRIEFRDK